MTEPAPDVVRQRVEEALQLRMGLPDLAALGPEPSPMDVVAHLVQARGSLDRIEGILMSLMRLRERAFAESRLAEARAEEKWDEASAGRQSSKRDYEGPRERYADNNLAALSERRQARAAKDRAEYLQTAVEVVRTAHRGADSVRNDLHAVLRAATFDRTYERGI